MTSKTYRHLTREQRYQIQALCSAGHSQTTIARILGVHKATISRELRRNATHSARPPDRYKAANAQCFASRRAYKPPKPKSNCPAIIRRIVWLIRCDWSPQQIAATCKARAIPMLSTEAIYLWLYEQANRKTKHQHLLRHLRRGHRKRRKRRLDIQPRIIIKDKTPISQRPAIVAAKQRSGDLEADLVKCRGGYLLTVTDRKTLYNLIAKIPNKEAATVSEAIVKILSPFKGKLFTLTSDNGTEFARHKQAAEALGIDWYFADPYCSQQRGCNENQNGLIRQYLTRKTDLHSLCEKDIAHIQNRLNYRPRKKLGYKTPVKLFLLPPGVALGD